MKSHPLETNSHLTRRSAIGLMLASAGLAACTVQPRLKADRSAEQPLFAISLAQWSLHRALYAGELDNLEFAPLARNEFQIDAVEYVNQFFKDRAADTRYLDQMKSRADDHGVRSLLIMCDGEGALGDPDPVARTRTIENHRKWLDAAAHLGCHSIRVNAESRGTWDEQRRHAADGLRRLTELAATLDLNVIVENHGGLSSNGRWLASVISDVDHPRCGTLPDFGNFRISEAESYDRYDGVQELMPFARAVSAKSYDFHDNGDETTIDYPRMMRIVVDAGYRGHVGIEYEGNRLPEFEGIRRTRDLLRRIRRSMSA